VASNVKQAGLSVKIISDGNFSGFKWLNEFFHIDLFQVGIQVLCGFKTKDF
jgi:hypothetical protein